MAYAVPGYIYATTETAGRGLVPCEIFGVPWVGIPTPGRFIRVSLWCLGGYVQIEGLSNCSPELTGSQSNSGRGGCVEDGI
eukprot:2505156-Rhodomonas_salina.2